MQDLVCLIRWTLVGLFRSKTSLEAEILSLRHQLNVVRRTSPRRPVFSNFDRMIFVCALSDRATYSGRPHDRPAGDRYPLASGGLSLLLALEVASRGGRPRVPREIRRLIREMSLANPLWGAPRIHGELLKLGIEVAQTTVAKYMARRRRPPSRLEDVLAQPCGRDRRDGLLCGSDDLFQVAVRAFILRHERRRYLAERHNHRDSRMDRPASHRGLRVGAGADYLVRDRDRATARPLRVVLRDGHSRHRQRRDRRGRMAMRRD